MAFVGVKLDWSVVVIRYEETRKILLVTDEYDSTGMANAYDLEGKQFKLEPDVGGFNGKTGKGWLDYWYNNRRLDCAYEVLEIAKEMKKMGIKRDDMVSIETLKKFEDVMNPASHKKHVEEESL